MNAKTLSFTGVSRFVVIALALLVASCIKPSYRIGGTVTGLSGTGLVLQNNGGDNVGISRNGAFTFSREVKKDAKYNVTVLAQPSGQTCSVANGAGTVTSTVTDVTVTCANGTSGFTLGGTASGVGGTGLVLQNNGADNLAIGADGGFTFPTLVPSGAAYSVTVFTQPSGQNCTVNNGSGTATANVTNVGVSCVSLTFTVGGTVSGVTGTGLVLQNNGANNLAISGNGAFTFSTALPNAAVYSVTVLTQPTGQGCTVANGSGTIAGANVTNVAVTCVAPPAAPIVSLAFGVKELQFSWGAVSGADFYRLLENPDGGSGYTEVVSNITATSYNFTIPVHRRLNASYIVEACNAGGCSDSLAMNLGANLAKTIGYMKASNTGAGDQYGMSVALSGDGNTLAVGARLEDSGSTGINSVPDELASNAGAVYVFARVGGVWSQQAYVKASNTAAGDAFGCAVALSSDGNTLAVGARSQAGSGATYVFTRSSGNWSQQAFLKASNAGSNDLFGNSLGLSGDGNTLAVGAPFESSALTGVTAGSIDEPTAGNGALFSGAVYVFARSGGAWSQQAYVKASNTASLDLFGNSVAIAGDGNTLAVGAPLEDGGLTGVTAGPVNEFTSGNAAKDSGAAYVYTRTSGAWSMMAYVKASNTGSGDNFGTSIALSGDGGTLAVGSPLEASSTTGIDSTPDDAAGAAGAVYVFTRLLDTWAQQAYVKASNTGAGDNFGISVALSSDGNALAVGAPFEDGSGTSIGSASDEFAGDSGAAYFYVRDVSTWSEQAYVKPTNTGSGDNFGTWVAVSDDGNTLAVGAPFEDGSSTGIDGTADDNATDAGAVYLY